MPDATQTPWCRQQGLPILHNSLRKCIVTCIGGAIARRDWQTRTRCCVEANGNCLQAWAMENIRVSAEVWLHVQGVVPLKAVCRVSPHFHPLSRLSLLPPPPHHFRSASAGKGFNWGGRWLALFYQPFIRCRQNTILVLVNLLVCMGLDFHHRA